MNGNAALWMSVLTAAATLAAALIYLLHPLLRRYALARPNARSSHKAPTPQGGGLAVIAATTITTFAAVAMTGLPLAPAIAVFAATAFIAAIGMIDDIWTITILPRLAAQAAAIAIVMAAMPHDLRVIQSLPWWPERLLLLVAALWFVNLVNFMDGIDWITVAEVVPVAAGLAVLGALGALPDYATIIAVALLGAMIGFAPFNKPVARLFLGDVGSLPIGLLLSLLLILLAGAGHIAAALLLPLYYLADATITLARRILRQEKFWNAHRSHFYQIALDRGMPVRTIVLRVFVLNIALVGLALISTLINSAPTDIACLATGAVLVAVLLKNLSRSGR